MKIISCYYWCWEVHMNHYMSWKLREAVACWIQTQRPENQILCSIWGQEMDDLVLTEKTTFLSFTCPQWTGWCLFILIRMIFITQYSKSNASLFQKFPYIYVKVIVYQLLEAFHSSIKVTYKIYHDLYPQHLSTGCLHFSKMLQ